MRKIILILAYIGLILCGLTLITSTYAYFTVEFETEEPSEIKLTTFDKTMKIVYTDTSNVSLVNAYTGSEFTKTFTVENTGEAVVYYNIIFDNLVNNFSEVDDLVYTLNSTNNGAVFNEKTMPYNNNIIASNIEIMPGVKQEYEMHITFKKTEKDQSANMNKTFSANIDIIESKKVLSGKEQYRTGTLGGIFKTTDVKSSFNINYKTLEEGIYYTNDSINGETTYFFRGSNLLNNNLIFAEKCFKIIRTTDNNGVRVIYNGELDESGTCVKNNLDKIAFNINSNYNAHVGYMYGSPSSTLYEEEHANNNSSNIKEYLESWYINNIEKHKKYTVDSVYCSNRKLFEITIDKVYYGKNGYGNKNTGYDSLKLKNDIPSLDCTNSNDRLNVQNDIGTKTLNYSIGLLTADEAFIAGITFKNNYLSWNVPYWTMTPAYYNGSNAYNYVVKDNKLVYNKTNLLNYVRPVITLDASSRLITGDGSEQNPYRIN